MKFITLTDPLPYQACVATIGFFDGVHRGHRFLIRQLTRYAAGHDLASLLITSKNGWLSISPTVPPSSMCRTALKT